MIEARPQLTHKGNQPRCLAGSLVAAKSTVLSEKDSLRLNISYRVGSMKWEIEYDGIFFGKKMMGGLKWFRMVLWIVLKDFCFKSFLELRSLEEKI